MEVLVASQAPSAPSDEEITSAVSEILRENMDISRNEIKTRLQTKFQWDLSDKKVLLILISLWVVLVIHCFV
jgi:hypothetical protein